MATVFDEHIGLWDSSIDVATVFADIFDGSHIIPPSLLFGNWFYAHRLGAPDVNQSYAVGGMGTPCYTLVNGNNIFSQITLLLGFGAVAYRLDDGIFLNVQKADVDTIGIVDGQEVECQHQAPRIIRFQKKIKNRLV